LRTADRLGVPSPSLGTKSSQFREQKQLYQSTCAVQ